MRALTLSVLVLLLLGLVPPPAAEALEKTKINLYYEVPLNRPILVTIDKSLDGYIKLESPEFDWEDDLVMEKELIL